MEYSYSIFSNAHIALLIIFSVLPISLAIILPKFNFELKKVLFVCMIISIISEIIKIVYFTVEIDQGFFLRHDSLPLHLCSIQILFIFGMYFTKSDARREKLVSFFIPTAFWGALIALVIPITYLEFGPLSLSTYQFFIYHAMLIFLALYLYITKFNTLNSKSIVHALTVGSLLIVGSIYLNGALQNGEHVNYFFTAAPPMEGLPLLNLDNGWLAYIIALISIGVFMISMTYLPPILKNKTANKK